MKAISLWQPWASAIALGHKRIETRHWYTRYRGPLAIHAAKRWGLEEREFAAVEHALGRLPKRIPLGAIVATCCLVEVRATESCFPAPVEKLYGNYSPGRFGWFLDNIQPLSDPIPFKGAQGFFNIPDELFVIERPTLADALL